MSTLPNVKVEKKRKTEDANRTQLTSKKQTKKGNSLLQYYFTKETVNTSSYVSVDSANKTGISPEKNASIDFGTEEHVCPVCQQHFSVSTLEEIEVHVNACLDKSIKEDPTDVTRTESEISFNSSTVTADIDGNGVYEEIRENNNRSEAMLEYSRSNGIPVDHHSMNLSNGNCVDNGASAWSNLFDTAKFKIRGIWSSRVNDVAPGLTENELSWFGEPKYASGPSKGKRKNNNVPYYKRLAGTSLVVDAFLYGDIPGCEGYFLSHFHSDHYMGLSANWTYGPIYCSEITAKLVKMKLGVSSDYVHPLPLDSVSTIQANGTDNEGQEIKVTLLDANHCPGAVIFLFQVGKLRYLHTGDFRACPKMCLNPLLKEHPIDILYLDTTYLNPKYSFPSQESCIKAACEVARRHNSNEALGYTVDKKINDWFKKPAEENLSPSSDERSVDGSKSRRVLIVIGTYSLGKERIFIEIAKTLNSKIFVPEKKKAILETFGDSELINTLVDDPLQAQVHVIPIRHVIPENLLAYFHSLEPNFSEMIAFKPTGWTFRASADPKMQQQQKSLESIILARPADLSATALKPYYDTPSLKIYGVPYSEHSSFRELALFIASLDIRRIVPTVNIYSERSRGKMSDLFEKWNADKKKIVERNGGLIKVIDYPSVDYW